LFDAESVASIPVPIVIMLGASLLLLTWRSRRVGGRVHREVAVCRECRYELQGLPEVVRCPECGLADARLRRVEAATNYDMIAAWRRSAAFLLLSAIVLLMAGLREVILNSGYTSGTGPSWAYAFSRGVVSGWAVAPLVLAGILVWVSARLGPGLITRTLVSALLSLVAGCLYSASVSPFRADWDLHTEATGVAYAALIGGLIVVWLCGAAWRAARRGWAVVTEKGMVTGAAAGTIGE